MAIGEKVKEWKERNLFFLSSGILYDSSSDRSIRIGSKILAFKNFNITGI